MPNSYQKAKAKKIAAYLLMFAASTEVVTMSELPELAARMSHSQWVTVSLQAGVPVADAPAKAYTVALLMGLR